MPQETKFTVFWAQYGRAVMMLCLFTLLLHDIFGPHGFLAMRRTKLEIERVQNEITRLNNENTELSGEVKSLKTDPHKIESIARDELGLVRPHDVVVKLPQSQQPQP